MQRDTQNEIISSKSLNHKKKNPKKFLICFRVDNMIVFMKRMVDQGREREEELKQWYLPD